MGLLYGRAGRLTVENGGFRPGQAISRAMPPRLTAPSSPRWSTRVAAQRRARPRRAMPGSKASWTRFVRKASGLRRSWRFNCPTAKILQTPGSPTQTLLPVRSLTQISRHRWLPGCDVACHSNIESTDCAAQCSLELIPKTSSSKPSANTAAGCRLAAKYTYLLILSSRKRLAKTTRRPSLKRLP